MQSSYAEEKIMERALNSIKISGTQTPDSTYTFAEVRQLVEEYLPNSTQALKIALAVATSGTRTNRVMLWMMLVGAPSSGKTDLVRLLRHSEAVLSLDNLTLNAFISGERPKGKEKVYDLLPQLNGKTLIVKDWTVIFSLDERMTKKIIGDMVGAYDKSLAKFSSRRGNITYNSEFSHLGCITPATLNRHHNYLNMIGPRFLTFTMPKLSAEEESKSFQAIFNDKDRGKQEEMVAKVVSGYLDQLNQNNFAVKPLSPDIQEYLKIASQFTARARGVVIIQASSFKDDSGNDVAWYEPLDTQIEAPWRAVQQLMILAQYLAFATGSDEVGVEELEIIRDVVISSMPADRAQAIRTLKENPEGKFTAKELSDQLDKSSKTARRLLEELSFLGVVDKERGGGQMAASYQIVNQFRKFICAHPREFVSSYSNSTKANSLEKTAGDMSFEKIEAIFA